MDSPRQPAEPPHTAAAPGNPPHPLNKPAPFIDVVLGIVREVPALLSDRVELLSLELQRAGAALAQILAFVVAIGILGVTAWVALWVGLAAGLVQMGLHWGLAIAAVLIINAVAVLWALSRIKALARSLGLPATRRHLTMSPATQPVSTPAPPAHEPQHAVPASR